MINGIGLIRFLLALLVALFHYFHFTDLNIIEQLAAGFFGVSLFFVLSGFLVTNMVIRNQYHLRPSGFVLNRAMRIYPTYFFTLVLAIFFVPAASSHLFDQMTRYDHLLDTSKYGLIGQQFIFWQIVGVFFGLTSVCFLEILICITRGTGIRFSGLLTLNYERI